MELIKTSWEPLGRQMLVSVVSAEEKKGSLIIPDVAQSTKRGMIQKVTGAAPSRFHAGDEIVFNPDDAFSVHLSDCGENALILQCDRVLLHQQKTKTVSQII